MVIVGVDLFDGNDPRSKLSNDLYYTIVQTADARSHISASARIGILDYARLAHERPARTDLENCIAGDL
jgi:hypothetical protein